MKYSSAVAPGAAVADTLVSLRRAVRYRRRDRSRVASLRLLRRSSELHETRGHSRRPGALLVAWLVAAGHLAVQFTRECAQVLGHRHGHRRRCR